MTKLAVTWRVTVLDLIEQRWHRPLIARPSRPKWATTQPKQCVTTRRAS